ncbi:MAG TPA: hypothetical protein VE956_06305 [Nodularia sp. (in: cyanobacteria)]|nr:hypothetical protein [Nodularia sp. (in: cyanobacteria)]
MNTGILAIALVTRHLFSGKLRFLKNTLHSRCLSFEKLKLRSYAK